MTARVLRILPEYHRADVAGVRCHPADGHGSRMLALRGRGRVEAVVIVRFDHDLGAAVTDGPSQRDHLHHVGTTAQDSRRGHDYRRSDLPGLHGAPPLCGCSGVSSLRR